MQFLEEAQPYCSLQQPALLQCLAQCIDVTPYLLIMEYCSLGDVKGYLRSCRAEGSSTPDILVLQQMACEIASGLQYLHKYNYIHSDLALRNCLLTSEMTVKIGDYGLSHSRYKDDYFVTADQIWLPLRWIAPELIDDVHGNLLVVDQTKASNVWSLGVTIWELFELGNQPYRHYSDKQVLLYVVKEQQLKLPKPLIKVPLSERWYEVMQFCWLQPEQRPVVEEVYLLMNYLCAKGTNEAEESFEKRWNSLRPSVNLNNLQRTPTIEVPSSTSPFPLLEHFSLAESLQSETGDEILTVTETSHGLNFEYKWEHTRAEEPYCSLSANGPLGSSNSHYQDIYYPLSSTLESCEEEGLNLSLSPSYYQSEYPGVVPVLSAHSPSVSSEYYIRIEEPVECSIGLEEGSLENSPGLGVIKSPHCISNIESPTVAQTKTIGEGSKHSVRDLDGSSDITLSQEPQQMKDPHHVKCKEQSIPNIVPNDKERQHCEQPPSGSLASESCLRNESICQTGIQETLHSISVTVSSPSLGQCDPYFEANEWTSGAYYNMIDSLQKNISRAHNVSVDVGDTEVDRFATESETSTLSLNHSTNNNTLNTDEKLTGRVEDPYLDLHHTSSSFQFQRSKAVAQTHNSTSNPSTLIKPHLYKAEASPITEPSGKSYIHLCSERRKEVESFPKIHLPQKNAFHLSPIESIIDLSSIDNSSNNTVSIPDATVWSKNRLHPSCASVSLVNIDDCSDGHVTDITCEVFPDSPVDFSEVGGISIEHIPVRSESQSRDIDSCVDLALSSSSCEAFSLDAYHTPIQPKSLDSGYDTENNESPEFVIKELEMNEFLSTSVESECEMVLQMDLEESIDDAVMIPTTAGHYPNDQYRDSAYFSDYDVESEKSPCEENQATSIRLEDNLLEKQFSNVNPLRSTGTEDGSSPTAERKDEKHFSRGTENAPNLVLRAEEFCVKRNNLEPNSALSCAMTPVITVLAPLPPEMGGCLTKESAVETGLPLESEQPEEESVLESMDSEDSTTTQETTAMDDIPHSASMSIASSPGQFTDETSENMETKDCDNRENNSKCQTDVKDNERKEVKVKAGVTQDGSLDNVLPALPENLDLPAPLGKCEEAEEDSEDTDESDEELCSYSVQDQSEESEEEFCTVPVVVSDRTSARHLRSLLKMPSLLTESFCDELEQKKKAVSFFDDVTVFLFDQDSPTGELSEYKFCQETESNENAHTQEHASASEISSTEKVLEESEALVSADDFPLMPSLSTSESALEKVRTPPHSPVKLHDDKPADHCSRFSVSRFSITQVSDSDMVSMEGDCSDDIQE